MKEILFRGKRIDNGRWICGGYFNADSRYFICDRDDTVQVDPETIGQFTGLVDRNGVKIFEDDVVKVEIYSCWELALVMYFDGCFFLFDSGYEDVPLFEHIDRENGRVAVEIIGNEHDNPGLWAGGSR